MDAKTVAEDFTALCKAGQFEEAGDKYWSPDVKSVEAMGDNPVSDGLAAVKAKSEWWYANHDVHSVGVEGPYVNAEQFALRFDMDITMKANGQRMRMAEIGVYTVKDGKVVEERFFYGG